MGSIYGHVGIPFEWNGATNNRGYFSVESLEEWCSCRPQPVRDIRVDRLGVPRWSSGKLEQKERMKRNENLPSYEK